MLYPSVYVIVGYCTAIPIAIAFILTLRQYIKHQYEHVLYMTLMWFFYLMWCLFHTTGSLLGSTVLYVGVGCYSLMPASFSVVLLGDTISRDSIDPKKLVMMTLASVFFIFTSLLGDWSLPGTYHFINGWRPFGPSYDFQGGIFIITMISFTTLLYYMMRIHFNVPEILKQHTKLLLWGGIFISLIGPSLFVSIGALVPGAFFINMGIGSLLISIAFIRQPKLAFFLPFKALRLVVVNTESGLSLYTYNWFKEEDSIDKNLISGMVQGISLILQKSLKRGNVREIALEEGVLIIHRSQDYDIACVLISTKTSRALREALNAFAEKFYDKFSELLTKSWETSQFEEATKLVNNFFSFIPDRY